MTSLVDRDLVVVDGPDAERYLQGQLSNEVAGLAVGESCWSLLLEPSGKLGFLVRVARVAPGRFELDADRGWGEQVETRLRRFLIRTKAEVERGVRSVDLDGDALVDDLDHGVDERPAGAVLVGWWGKGVHRVAPSGPLLDEAALAARRVAAGWPAHGHELTDGVIPGATLLVPVTASFTKGCYTGQELVARVDSRGNNVPETLHRVELTSDAVDGAEIETGGRVVGHLTTVAGRRALAYVHRSVVAPADVTVGGAPARITALTPQG
jgi:tRNA-modifying protein YgfZ